MDEKLVSILNKVIKLCGQHPEFGSELRQQLEVHHPQAVVALTPELESQLTKVKKDISKMHNIMQIGDETAPSISYDFVKDKRIRDQLLIDNVRMENLLLDTRISEDDRFPLFCVNAFYQVENLLNYYYHTMFPDLKSLEDMLKTNTSSEKESFKYANRKGIDIRSVSDIQSHYLINAFCNYKSSQDGYFKYRLSGLRLVRNKFSHRSFDAKFKWKDPEKGSYLNIFLEHNTFITVRQDLQVLVSLVAQDLLSLDVSYDVPAVVSTMLPSSCFVKYEGKTEGLPAKLLGRVSGRKVGDQLTLTIRDRRIVDVK